MANSGRAWAKVFGVQQLRASHRTTLLPHSGAIRASRLQRTIFFPAPQDESGHRKKDEATDAAAAGEIDLHTTIASRAALATQRRIAGSARSSCGTLCGAALRARAYAPRWLRYAFYRCAAARGRLPPHSLSTYRAGRTGHFQLRAAYCTFRVTAAANALPPAARSALPPGSMTSLAGRRRAASPPAYAAYFAARCTARLNHHGVRGGVCRLA